MKKPDDDDNLIGKVAENYVDLFITLLGGQTDDERQKEEERGERIEELKEAIQRAKDEDDD